MKLGLRRHGNTHDPAKGSDPLTWIRDFLRFNFDNEGGWLYIVANDSTDIDFGELGFVLGETTGQGFFLFSHDTPQTKIGSVLMTPDEITVALDSSLFVTINRATGTFTLYDSSNNPLLQMTDGSPDLHIPVGGNVVADLT